MAVVLSPSMPATNSGSSAVPINIFGANLQKPADMEERSRSQSKPAHKILHYGSRHVIQNTGWTTRLTKELPHLKPVSHPAKPPTIKSDSVTAVVSTSKLSETPINKPTVSKQNNTQTEVQSASNSVMIQLIGPNASNRFINISQPLPKFISTQTSMKMPKEVSSGGLISVPLPLFGGPRKPVTSSFLGLPSAPNSFSPTNSIRAPSVCFVPISRSGPVSITVGGVVNVLSMAGQKTVVNTALQSETQKQNNNIRILPAPPTTTNCKFTCINLATPSSAVGVQPSASSFSNGGSNIPVTESPVFSIKSSTANGVSNGDLNMYATPSSAPGIKFSPAVDFSNSGSKMSASKTVRTLSVFPSLDGSGCPDIRVLNTQVRIHKGLVTEVNELMPEPEIPSVPVLSTSNILSCAPSTGILFKPGGNHLPVYLMDCNGAKFGYYETLDGKRIRIAHDTSGQRYSPFWLVPPRVGPFVDSDVVIDVASDADMKTIVLPTEAQVSAVTTLFTYEPLIVSEQTLVPVSGSSLIPKPSVASVANDDDQSYVYRCYMCKFWSEDKIKLASHWLNFHMPDLQYCCPYCDRKFFTNVRAQMHVLHHHPEYPTPKITFRRSAHFANTLSFELVPDLVTENVEDGNAIILEQVDKFSASDNTTYACRRCYQTTHSAAELRQHQKVPLLKSKPIICLHCPLKSGDESLSFASECDLKLHIRAHHHELNRVVSGLPLQTQVARMRSTAKVVLQADIPWDETWEEIYVSSQRMLQCRRCTFRTKLECQMWPHVLSKHQWPITAVCPFCVATITLKENERSAGIAVCDSCEASVILGPTYSTGPSGAGQVVYVCNSCSYKTLDHSVMMQHIRYNHTKGRPYACSSCNFVDVEYKNAQLHVETAHPNKPSVVKDHLGESYEFKEFLSTLFKKLVSVQLADSKSAHDLNSSVENGSTSEFATLPRDSNMSEASNSQSYSSQTNPQVDALCEHFKCKVCSYCCTDRSCMSRHIKYMHITARPHSCPYCPYNNVEKTKVRIHVKTHHPGQQKYVRTDRKLLEEMSWCAKKFYVMVDKKGREMPHKSMRTGNSENVFGATHAVDRIVVLNKPLLNCENTQHVTNDELSFDDVEFELRPDWYNDENIELVGLHPVVAMDHNYLKKVCCRPSAEDEVHAAVVKDEPTDIESEDHHVTVNDADVKPNLNALDMAYENDNDISALSPSWSDIDDDFSSSEMSDDSISVGGDEDEDTQFPLSYSLESVDVKEEVDLEEELLRAEMLVKQELIKEQGFLAHEPAAKKRKTTGSGDEDTSHSTVNWDSLKIDKKVLSDAKICMKAVVELEDVLQIILAWQNGTFQTEDDSLVV